MTFTMLLTILCIAGAAVIVALMMRRRRLPAGAVAEHARWRDSTFANMLLSVAASVGIARAQAENQSDGGYSWHGGHLGHGPGHAGGFSDGGGFGGDAGGGGAS
jgi:hypothetical protein